MVRHERTCTLDLSSAGLSPSGFLDFFLMGFPLTPRVAYMPLVAAVLIIFKGAESPGSGRIGVLRVGFFPHLRPFKMNFALFGQPSSAPRH